jgi:hypothetical protein
VRPSGTAGVVDVTGIAARLLFLRAPCKLFSGRNLSDIAAGGLGDAKGTFPCDGLADEITHPGEEALLVVVGARRCYLLDAVGGVVAQDGVNVGEDEGVIAHANLGLRENASHEADSGWLEGEAEWFCLHEWFEAEVGAGLAVEAVEGGHVIGAVGREDDATSGADYTPQLAQRGELIGNVVEHVIAHHTIECSVREREALDAGTRYGEGVLLLGRSGSDVAEHRREDVYGRDAGTARGEHRVIDAGAAAGVEDAIAGGRGEDVEEPIYEGAGRLAVEAMSLDAGEELVGGGVLG